MKSNNKLVYWILSGLLTVCLTIGGLLYKSQAQNDIRHDEQIEKLYKDKASWESIQKILEMQEKQYDRMYDELKDLREKQTEVIREGNTP